MPGLGSNTVQGGEGLDSLKGKTFNASAVIDAL
jgi:hypothetical protein